MRADNTPAICRRIFDMEPHQVRHLLDTFKTPDVAQQFLISDSYVVLLRRMLGCRPRRRGVVLSAVNGVPGPSAWRTPDLPMRRAA